MFKETKAFSGFSVDNLQKAREFYGDILKIDISEMKEMGLLQLHIAGSNDLIIYEKPNHTPATFTVLNFPVPDIDQAVKDLKALGVAFESYDFPELKTDGNNISRGNPSVAWFTDPAGNILSVIQE
ncbi:VOC family protein [Dyadobacter chenwenxiniae]|uniref:VOC family protein n=1 Tax=Dyadobacter chenwenxiniae TaxID=2906456 RepID=A0A9X1PLM7_9BACT|nr:VOC family protein [Dyadobacter chenwenxiniae]MCF0063091.1 VOC family protein [Dyadobacter chenwenxiniae]UON84737.1 VOC family protein [Dyadobacter chenwenxiniae]